MSHVKIHPVPLKGEDLSSHLTCSICLSVPTDPILTGCEHLFCNDCFSRSMETSGRNCPNCRASPVTSNRLQPGSMLYRIWSDIQVKCGHCDRGCAWSGSIVDAKGHIETCPYGDSSRKLMEEIKRLKAALAEAEEKHKTVLADFNAIADAQISAKTNQLIGALNDKAKLQNEIQMLNQLIQTNALLPRLFYGDYYFDRNNVVTLVQFISRHLDSPPADVNTNKIYNCVRSCYIGLEKNYDDNPRNYRIHMQMLLSTCLSSSWFTNNQWNSIEQWMMDQGWY